MILAWPALAVIALSMVRARRFEATGRGWRWSIAWMLAGFLMSFSLITGFSIGLFVLPFAAISLIWTAWRSPHLLEASGFVAGIAITALLLVAVQT